MYELKTIILQIIDDLSIKLISYLKYFNEMIVNEIRKQLSTKANVFSIKQTELDLIYLVKINN